MDTTAPAQPIDYTQHPLIIQIGHPHWRDAVLASLPHLWVGFTVAFAKLIQTASPQIFNRGISGLSTASLGIFLLLSVGVVVYAWRRSWPLWTASWYTYALWLFVIALGYLFVQSGGDNWILNAVLLLSSFTGIGLGYVFLFRYSRLHAILVALFLLPVASQLGLEAIPDVWEAFIALFFGFLAALVAMYIVRSRDWPKGVALALLANLLAGAALTYIHFYWAEIPGYYGDTFADVLLAFTIYIGSAVMLFLGPWVLWSLWDIVKGKTW